MLSADGIAPWDPIVLGLARQTSGVKSLLLPVRSVVNEKAAHRSAPAIERAPVATSDIIRLVARVLISLRLFPVSRAAAHTSGPGDLERNRDTGFRRPAVSVTSNHEEFMNDVLLPPGRRMDIARWEGTDSRRAPDRGARGRGDILVAAEYVVRIEPAFERAKALKSINAKGGAHPVDLFVGIHIVDVCGAIE